MAEDEAKKSAENLARLPPKLRERLLKRGILADKQVKSCQHFLATGCSDSSTPPPPPGEVPTGALHSEPPPPPDDPAGTPGLGTPPGAPGTPPEAPGTPPDEDDDYDPFSTAPDVPEEAQAAAATGAFAKQPASLFLETGAIAKQPPPAGALAKQPPPAGALAKQPPPAGTLAKQPPPAGASAKQFSVSLVPARMAQTLPGQLPGILPIGGVPPPGLPPGMAYPPGMEAAMTSLTMASKPSAGAAAAAPKAIYSAAPQINKAAVLNKRPAVEAAEDASEAKRQATAATAAAAQAASPAAARAAEAGYAQAPTYELAPTAAAAATAAMKAVERGLPAEVPRAAAPRPSDPSLPPGWVQVPHEGDFYYWNTLTDEVKWEDPAGPKVEPPKPVFTEKHKILWSDVGKIIGRQGINLKIIKCSIGCEIKIPRQGGKGVKDGKGKGKDKGKDKGKGKDKEPPVRGRGDGSTQLGDSDFAEVTITADTAHLARGGKRCLEVMLGYGRTVERALTELGVEVKMPSLSEMDPKLGKAAQNSKDGIDPMDPAAYSDAPVGGGWGAGMAKRGADGKLIKKASSSNPSGADSKTANAERC